MRQSANSLPAERTLRPTTGRAFVDAQNDGYQHRSGDWPSGLSDFALPDQHGRSWGAAIELMGPNGLLLVFSRSADW